MMEDPIRGLKALVPVEELAEDILRDQSEIVALDKRRNENREGVRALTKCREKKVWMSVGPMLLRLPGEQAKTMLQEDIKSADVQVNTLRSDLKIKINKLRDLEYQDPVPGFNLKPLTKEEFSAVGQALYQNA